MPNLLMKYYLHQNHTRNKRYNKWFCLILKAGDEILVSALEHHSNIVPWQMLAERTGAVLRVIPMNENGS
jgi:selenocysteine lyase/cysteine desulfurase